MRGKIAPKVSERRETQASRLDSRAEEAARRKDEEHHAQHDTEDAEDDAHTTAMYANNVSNLDQILSSLQCYLVRTRLDTHSPPSSSAWMKIRCVTSVVSTAVCSSCADLVYFVRVLFMRFTAKFASAW